MKKLDPIAAKMNIWRPNYVAKSIADIDFDMLSSDGIRCLAVDVDGTLVAGIFDHSVSSDISRVLKRARRNGRFNQMYIATNRLSGVEKIAHDIAADGIFYAKPWYRKPMKSYYQNLLEVLDYPPDQIAMVGDRLWQDIMGANRVGLQTVLVQDFGPPQWYDWLLARRFRQNRIKKRLGIPTL